MQNTNFLGDVLTAMVRRHQNFKFVFKRKIYVAKNDAGFGDDPMQVFEALCVVLLCVEPAEER